MIPCHTLFPLQSLVLSSFADHIGTLTLNSNERRNALSGELVEQ